MFESCGMPLHNAPYQNDNFNVEMKMIKFELEINNNEPIKNIIPKPLEYSGNMVYLIGNQVEIKSGNVHENLIEKGWKEIVIQIPVNFKGERYNYLSEAFTNNPGIVLLDREIFGQPRLYADVKYQSGESGGISVNTFIPNTKKSIISMKYKMKRKGEMKDLGERAKIICMKHIPSAVVNEEPAVKQLITMNYTKQKLLNFFIGEGEFKFSEYSPAYIKEAGIKDVKKAYYLNLELGIYGGNIIYDYKNQKV